MEGALQTANVNESRNLGFDKTVKVKLLIPLLLERNISKTAADAI